MLGAKKLKVGVALGLTVGSLILPKFAQAEQVRLSQIAESIANGSPYSIRFAGDRNIQVTLDNSDGGPPAHEPQYAIVTGGGNILATTLETYAGIEELVSEGRWGVKYYVTESPTRVQVTAGARPAMLINLAEVFSQTEAESNSEYPTTLYFSGHKVLSFVGPLLSVEMWSHGHIDGTAHPWAYSGYQAYDLEKGGQANLTDYFSADEFVAALKKDTFLLDAVKKAELSAAFTKASTFEQVSEVLSRAHDCLWFWPGAYNEVLSLFAIYDYDAKSNKASVRVGLPYGCEAARGQLTQLGLKLTPTTSDFALVLAKIKAKEKPGRFMSSVAK